MTEMLTDIQYPATEAEAAELIRLTPPATGLIPAGNLSRLSGHPALSRPDALVVSASRLTGLHVEPGNLSAVAGAGLTPDQVNDRLAGTGLYWPLTGVGSSRSLGGVMADGSLGAETMAKGSMGDWILGARFVTAEGEAVTSGGGTLKNVSGYDFTRLAWRSKGRLALATEFILKLLPRPARAPVAAIETTAPEAADLAEAVITGRLAPEALRLVARDRGATLLVWFTGFPEVVEARASELAALAGSRPLIWHEDGFAFWRTFQAGRLTDGPGVVRLLGSRRAVLDLSRHLDRLPLLSADLDLGGGRADLALSGTETPPDFPGLTPDRFVSSGLVYQKVKAALDPRDRLFPSRLES